MQLARDLLSAEPGGGRIVLVTDRPVDLPSDAAVETRLAAADGERENVGIVRLNARPLPGSPETDEVLVEIENFGTQHQAGAVELTFEGRLLDVKPFDLAPGERRTDVYPALAARTGIANARGWLSAHLALKNGAGDSLPLDDNAYAVVPPPRPIRILLVTRGNFFLESLLKADDGVRFDLLAPDAYQPAQATAFDAVVLDDFIPSALAGPPERWPPGNFLCVRGGPFAAAGTELGHPLVTDADAASPLLRRVNLRESTILRALSWELPPTPAGEWLFNAPVRAFEHPLVVTGERRPAGAGGRPARLVALAFGVTDSDLPLRVAFPLFIHNSLEWLAGRDELAGADNPVRAGDVIEIPAGAMLWTRPQHDYAPVGEIPAAESVAGPGTFQPLKNGFYLRRAGGNDQWLAVDTLDREMSAVQATQKSEQTPAAPTLPAIPVIAGHWWESLLPAWPPWMQLTLLGGLLCTLEWWGFHRRRTE